MIQRQVYIFQSNKDANEFYMGVGATPGDFLFSVNSLFGVNLHAFGEVDKLVGFAKVAKGNLRVRGAGVIGERHKAKKIFFCKNSGCVVNAGDYYWKIVLTGSGLAGLKFADRVCLEHFRYMVRFNRPM